MGSSFNFMPESRRSFFFYTAAWVIFSVLFEMVTLSWILSIISPGNGGILHSTISLLLYLSWHLHYIRSN
ncbi:hypothetical protein VL14_11945 [Cytobacillus firmus]|nr:hypothetical protein VL14_11945 [Cytobacillus firmus]